MSNDFFNHSANRISEGTTARASQVNAIADEIGTGLDKLPSEANIKRGKINYATATEASANTYTVTLPYTPTAYVDGMGVKIKFPTANTDVATLNVDSLGAKSIKRQNGDALEAGDLVANKIVELNYNSTSGYFELQTAPPGIVTTAMNWATLVGAAVISGYYSAKEWAVGTFTRGTAGGGSAKDWATYTGGTVDDADYSAKYHADAASSSASSASSSASSATDSASAASTSETNAAASASAAAASAATVPSYPTLTGNALRYPRLNSGETAMEFRTAAETRSDLGVGATSPTITAADEDLTITEAQFTAYDNLILDLSAWTQARNVIVPTVGRNFGVDTTGTYTATVKTSAGTGIDVTAGTARPLLCDGTNVVDPLTHFASAASVAEVESDITSLQQGGALTIATAQASTSGTAIDFTGIPSWAKKITVSLNGVSIDATANLYLAIGDSGGIELTGYLCSVGAINGGATANYTSGFLFTTGTVAATIHHGILILSLLDASENTWAMQGSIGLSNAAQVYVSGGSKALSAALDRLRISSVGGTANFDAGSINILYE